MAHDGDFGLRSGLDPAFRADVLAGLSAGRRTIPPRWLYDRRGSELFEAITELPEYYCTRVERAILADALPGIAAQVPSGLSVIELGSGSSSKTSALLDAVGAAAYVPIDISGEFLRQSVRALAALHPSLAIWPVEADFLAPLSLPEAVRDAPRLGFFPGSTIGNMAPFAAVSLLRGLRETLGHGAWLVIGMDRVKPRDRLLAAYDDAAGVTAAFNLNLLTRINRELDGDIPLDAFRHRVRWDAARARIEMHLHAVRDVAFRVAGHAFHMAAGETIHTENSHKYEPDAARQMLAAGGWLIARRWSDPDDNFMVVLAEADPEFTNA